MEHVVTVDNGAPLAFDRTPLSIAREGMRGPRTPFSPERIVVSLPNTNPEEEESLAGELERQGATLLIIINDDDDDHICERHFKLSSNMPLLHRQAGVECFSFRAITNAETEKQSHATTVSTLATAPHTTL